MARGRWLGIAAFSVACVEVSAPPKTTSPTPSPEPAPAAQANWLVKDFESAQSKSGYSVALTKQSISDYDHFKQESALGPSGERDDAVAAVESAGGVSFGLSAEHRSMHYEIVRE